MLSTMTYGEVLRFCHVPYIIHYCVHEQITKNKQIMTIYYALFCKQISFYIITNDTLIIPSQFSLQNYTATTQNYKSCSIFIAVNIGGNNDCTIYNVSFWSHFYVDLINASPIYCYCKTSIQLLVILAF